MIERTSPTTANPTDETFHQGSEGASGVSLNRPSPVPSHGDGPSSPESADGPHFEDGPNSPEAEDSQRQARLGGELAVLAKIFLGSGAEQVQVRLWGGGERSSAELTARFPAGAKGVDLPAESEVRGEAGRDGAKQER